MRIILLLCAILVPTSLAAQTRDGQDTASDWVVDHYKPFGLWDSICDHRMTEGVKKERCYLRYVEVFSPRPNFAAQFVFVTPEPQVEIGLERGTLFDRDGMRVEDMGGTLWSTNRLGCRTGLTCTFTGEEAEALLAAMEDGTVFAFDFTDRHGAPQKLRWDLTRFADAIADFRREADLRGL